MPEDIKVPGLGQVPKKYVIGGVVVGAGIAVIVYVRAKKNANASGAGTSSALVTDPAGNQCTALDPNSGYCPGSAEDTAYQQQLVSGGAPDYGYGGDYGYPSGGGAVGNTTGLVSDPAGNQCAAVNPLTGYCPGSPQDIAASESGVSTTGTGTTAPTGLPTTNSQWLADALTLLPGDQSSNQAALASVLGGLTVTTAQRNVFLEAVGLVGENPPQGYPQPIKTSDTAAHPGPGGTPKTAGAISGLSVHGVNGGIAASWKAASGATGGYSWVVRDLASHSQVKNGKTSGTSVTVGGLKKGTDYNFGIQALPGGPGDNDHAVAG